MADIYIDDAGRVTIRYAPDSIYAGYTAVERDAADRMEAEFNHETRLHLASLVHTNHVRVSSDASLARLAKHYRRQLEDIADGSLSGGEGRARLVRAQLHDVEREQGYRSRLADSWLAGEGGTHCYGAFEARGGLGAVLYHGATPPTYYLAAMLDWRNWKRGLPHVLAWGEERGRTEQEG